MKENAGQLPGLRGQFGGEDNLSLPQERPRVDLLAARAAANQPAAVDPQPGQESNADWLARQGRKPQQAASQIARAYFGAGAAAGGAGGAGGAGAAGGAGMTVIPDGGSSTWTSRLF